MASSPSSPHVCIAYLFVGPWFPLGTGSGSLEDSREARRKEGFLEPRREQSLSWAVMGGWGESYGVEPELGTSWCLLVPAGICFDCVYWREGWGLRGAAWASGSREVSRLDSHCGAVGHKKPLGVMASQLTVPGARRVRVAEEAWLVLAGCA